MKIAAMTAAVLLALTACTGNTPGTPKPDDSANDTEKCGEVICVTQKRPECNNRKAIWKFDVFHVNRDKKNKDVWKYTRRITEVVNVGPENIEKEDLIPVLNRHPLGLTKEHETIALYSGALTVSFVAEPDGHRYKLNWNDICGKDA